MCKGLPEQCIGTIVSHLRRLHGVTERVDGSSVVFLHDQHVTHSQLHIGDQLGAVTTFQQLSERIECLIKLFQFLVSDSSRIKGITPKLGRLGIGHCQHAIVIADGLLAVAHAVCRFTTVKQCSIHEAGFW